MEAVEGVAALIVAESASVPVGILPVDASVSGEECSVRSSEGLQGRQRRLGRVQLTQSGHETADNWRIDRETG